MEMRNRNPPPEGDSEDSAKTPPPKPGGPLLGVTWMAATFGVLCYLLYRADYNSLQLVLGWRSILALLGYAIMQYGLWKAEFKWDEEGSVAWLKAAEAGKDQTSTPEELEATKFSSSVVIPPPELKAAFPVPWGFLIGWWVWGGSYLFPIDGGSTPAPTTYGMLATAVCFAVSYVASIPMSAAVMNRDLDAKKKLSLMFLVGWITLGVLSGKDVSAQLGSQFDLTGQLFLCLIGPFTVILSQKILFEARKMGTFWEEKGSPNFNPIVYNMGSPLFVWGWFLFWLGTSSVPLKIAEDSDIYSGIDGKTSIPLFLNFRTALAFFAGCGMVPVVGFLDYSHDLDGPWIGGGKEGKLFSKWWLGTDGTFYGVFLESPWPFVIMWTLFGFSSLLSVDNLLSPGMWQIVILINCVLQGVDAGILIQQNLYAGNMEGKNKWSLPFVLLFILLAVNIGQQWSGHAFLLSIPGAILIILGQKTVFGARRRGDYTMKNDGRANPYGSVWVYSWGEVFFMMGWILICWGMAMPHVN